MKNVLVSMIVLMISSNLFASTINCQNTYSDDEDVKISMDKGEDEGFTDVKLTFIGKTQEFPFASYDSAYRPTNPKNAMSSRYRLMIDQKKTSSYSLMIPKVISSNTFIATFVESSAGYHGETGYHKVTCKY